jgi:phage gp46-like protein
MMEGRMMRKNFLLRALLVLALLCAAMLFAQTPPVQNIDPQRNPNLAEAQKLCNEAFEWIVKAQQANNYDMQGHAEKAKQLLVQATQELAIADKIADSAKPVAAKGPTNAQTPVQNIDPQRNPNLAEAQKLCNQAFQWIVKAQRANKYDMQGHAEKAKQLLVQAAQELAIAHKIADSVKPGAKK